MCTEKIILLSPPTVSSSSSYTSSSSNPPTHSPSSSPLLLLIVFLLQPPLSSTYPPHLLLLFLLMSLLHFFLFQPSHSSPQTFWITIIIWHDKRICFSTRPREQRSTSTGDQSAGGPWTTAERSQDNPEEGEGDEDDRYGVYSCFSL